MKHFMICMALSLALPLPALSQEFGQIAATYDGEERTWYTIARESGGETQATATYGSSLANFFDLHIQGHPRPTFTSTDVLSVDAMVQGGIEAGGRLVDVEILHIPDGISRPTWTSQDAPTRSTLSIEAIETGEPGETGTLTGTFSGQVCLRESMTAEPDPMNCRMIEGRIKTRILLE